MTDPVLRLLRERPDLAELAAFPFGFDIGRAYHVEDVHLASGASLEPVAGDDTGGTYFVCADGAVLYASSEGEAVLVGGSVTEALEILVGLPSYCEGIEPGLDEEQLLAALREADAGAREQFAPELDAQRAALVSGLGLPVRPPLELLGLSYAAARRTEPDHLLLNSAELCAYRLPEGAAPAPLRDVVLAPGRAALERMRSGGPASWTETGADPVLRAGVVRAAQYDRRADDLPLLRFLLERESAECTPWFEERRLATVLVALHGRAEDIPLVRSAHGGCAPDDPAGVVAWAREEDAKRYGPDPATESDFTWIGLARRQGRTEHARVALIRMLDDTGPDAERLRGLSRALEDLGDHGQATRAQFDLASLQDTGWDRAAETYVLARVERRKGDLAAAGRALGRARVAVGLGDGPAPDETVAEWHRRGLGRQITEQHLELVLAAVEAGDHALARETMAHAKLLLKTIAGQFRSSLSELSTRAKWAVAALPRA
ncbi:hypothetical protein QFZ82_002109 [Streptomyces sp. V4I23]|uniref:hypothetical protein n=1 Tax=Streptomyces sp. V4I23 TaxID=3042282 RepID=UPI00278082F8|nr:hypothetical protein [Streptomyces sp. V4I23]MDQ1007624.1 hypothetical protein [Streptomyces sp. V4I23]